MSEIKIPKLGATIDVANVGILRVVESPSFSNPCSGCAFYLEPELTKYCDSLECRKSKRPDKTSVIFSVEESYKEEEKLSLGYEEGGAE